MEKTVHFFLLLMLLISCRKTKEEIIPEQESPREVVNTLVSGKDCSSFERLLKGYKFEELRAVKPCPDGGYILCGSTETIAASEYDILVIKTDCFGKTEWMKTVSNKYADFGVDIIPLSSGDYLVTANFANDPGNWKMISYQGQFILLDENGDVVSKRTIATGSATELTKTIEMPDGGFLTCGSDHNAGNFILKADAHGNINWKKFLGTVRLTDVCMLPNKNVIACGSIVVNQQAAIYLCELNAAGDTLWTKSIDKHIDAGASSLTVLSNNDIALAGTYRTSNTTFAGFTMRLDATGKEIWYKSLEAEGFQSLANIAATADNDVVTAGKKAGTINIIKLDFNTGSVIWAIPKASNSWIYDVHLSANGGFVMAGSLFQGNNTEGYILKTDDKGN